MNNNNFSKPIRREKLLLVFLILLMSVFVTLPSGCLDEDSYDQQVDAREPSSVDDEPTDNFNPLDIYSVNTSVTTDEPAPTENSSVQTTIAYISGRGGSSSSSSSSTSPDVSRIVISGDYTEPIGTITGDLTIAGATSGTITLPAGLIVNGDLTLNTPSATVNNYATVGGTINIDAVSVNTWNHYGNAGSIFMGAENATFYFFSGNITEGVSLTRPCSVVIDVNATGLPLIIVTEDAEGSDIDNLGSDELNLTTQANVTVAGYVNVTEVGGYNVTVYERVSTPIASPTAGAYVGAQNVTLTTATDGATIYYTTDGNEPTNTSAVYTNPIEVAVNMTIKAIGVKEGLAHSGVTEFAYLITILPSTDADLSAMTVSFGTLDPAFDADTTAYTVNVDYDITVINVTATQSDSAASMEFNGEVATNAVAKTVTLQGPGESTEIIIEVTAEDTTTAKNYNIIVNRGAVQDIQSVGVGITQGSAVFGYEFFSDENSTIPITYNNATIAPYYLNTTASTVRLERGSNFTADIPLVDMGIGADGTVTYEDLNEVETAFGNPGFVNNWGGAPTHIVLNLTGGQDEYIWTFDAIIVFDESDMNAFVSIISHDANLSVFTVGGEDVLSLDGLDVENPVTNPGAQLEVSNFTGFQGIVATATNYGATVTITLNEADVTVTAGTEPIADDDVILVVVVAEDGTTTKYYKVTAASILVTEITVTGAESATSLVNEGTLQMSAAILPANATDPSVTWSITTGTGNATISETGLLTATEVGTVTVKATAADGSGSEGTLVVTVT